MIFQHIVNLQGFIGLPGVAGPPGLEGERVSDACLYYSHTFCIIIAVFKVFSFIITFLFISNKSTSFHFFLLPCP